MKIIPVAEAKAKLSEYIQLCQKEAVFITKNGRPKAMIIPINEQDDLETLALSFNRKFQKQWLEARKRFQEGKGIPHDQFWDEIEKETP